MGEGVKPPLIFIVKCQRQNFELHKLKIININSSVRLVTIKNRYSFLHPDEALEHTETGLEIPKKVPRNSKDKRINDILWFTSDFEFGVDDDLVDGNDEEQFQDGNDEEQLQDGNDDEQLQDGNEEEQLQINHNEIQIETSDPDAEINVSRGHMNVQIPQSSQQVRSPSTGFYGRSLANIKKFVQSKRRGILKLPDPSTVFVIGNYTVCLFSH